MAISNEKSPILYELSIKSYVGSTLLRALKLPERDVKTSKNYDISYFIPFGRLVYIRGDDRPEFYTSLQENIGNAYEKCSKGKANVLLVAGSDIGRSTYVVQYLAVEGLNAKEGPLYKARTNTIGKVCLEVILGEKEEKYEKVFLEPSEFYVCGRLHMLISDEESKILHIAKEKRNIFLDRDKKNLKDMKMQNVNLSPNSFMLLSENIGNFGFIGMYGCLLL